MRFLRFLLLFVACVALFLIALDKALAGLWGLPPHPVLDWIRALDPTLVPSEPGGWRLLWVAVLAVLAIYLVLAAMALRRKPRTLRVKTAGGDVMLIPTSSVVKFVRTQLASHPAVVSQRIRVRQAGARQIALSLLVNVRPIETLPEIKRELEAIVRNGFTRIMGIDELDKVDIVLGLDDRNLNYQPQPAMSAAPAPEPPVRTPNDEAAMPATAAGATAGATASAIAATTARQPESAAAHLNGAAEPAEEPPAFLREAREELAAEFQAGERDTFPDRAFEYEAAAAAPSIASEPPLEQPGLTQPEEPAMLTDAQEDADDQARERARERERQSNPEEQA